MLEIMSRHRHKNKMMETTFEVRSMITMSCHKCAFWVKVKIRLGKNIYIFDNAFSRTLSQAERVT